HRSFVHSPPASTTVGVDCAGRAHQGPALLPRPSVTFSALIAALHLEGDVVCPGIIAEQIGRLVPALGGPHGADGEDFAGYPHSFFAHGRLSIRSRLLTGKEFGGVDMNTVPSIFHDSVSPFFIFLVRLRCLLDALFCLMLRQLSVLDGL